MTQSQEEGPTPVQVIQSKIDEYAAQQASMHRRARWAFTGAATGAVGALILFGEGLTERKTGVQVNQMGQVVIEYGQSQLSQIFEYGTAAILTIATGISTGLGIEDIQKERSLAGRVAGLEQALAEHALTTGDISGFTQSEQP